MFLCHAWMYSLLWGWGGVYSDLPGWESFQRSSPTVASRTSLQLDPLLLSLITLYFLIHHIWNLAPYLCSPGKLFLLHPLFLLPIPSFQFCLLSTLLLFVIWGLACYSFLHSAHPDLPVTAVPLMTLNTFVLTQCVHCLLLDW